MALIVKDRVQETTTTTGTGTLTLDGAVTGFQTFSSAIGNTNTTYYAISSNDSEFEVGIGTVGAGTLARTTILASSNGGSVVTLSAGTKNVFCTQPAEKALYTDASSVFQTGIGTSVATFLVTPSSANLASAITDETGSGALVFGTSPTLTTPKINTINDSNGNEEIIFTTTASAVNELTIANADTTNAPAISATGGDTNIDLNLTPKGIGRVTLGAGKIQQIAEKVTNTATAATGTINYDVITQAVLNFTTNATANWTLNVRGDSSNSLNSIMDTGESITIAHLVPQGGTAYYNSAFQIDGNAITPEFQGGSAPTAGNINSIDVYTYVIIKTGSATFTVLATQTRFA
jgi:hypothetical protein